jgi:hypothetical protein
MQSDTGTWNFVQKSYWQNRLNKCSKNILQLDEQNKCYRGGIYDQQDATNSQYLLLEMLYMFRAIMPIIRSSELYVQL